MLLAALIDAGADTGRVNAAVDSLGVPGLTLRPERGRRGGFGCLQAHVEAPQQPDVQRNLTDVQSLIRKTHLGRRARDYAEEVFGVLAAAEAAVHEMPTQKVHFHEVGAFDALADVVGCAAAFEDLGLLTESAKVLCSALATGSGTVRAEHGTLPVPTPAVLRIAASAGLTLAGGELGGERTTPTGAALLATIARPGPFPPMTVRTVGIGGGSRDTPDQPNITRVVLGTAKQPRHSTGEVVLLESTVDDLEPQLWPSVLRAVRSAGAWDCWTSPITARHGRPGQVVSVVCDEATRPAVVDTLFRHTTTIGVRWSHWQRATLPRHSVTLEVGPPENRHPVTVKVSELDDGTRTIKPELADVEAAAAALEVPVRALVDEVLTEFQR
jgi:uncharacterized protein (TIGR00299 family) protein